MQITYLANHPNHTPTLAEWHQAQWGYLRPSSTVTWRAQRLATRANYREIPTTFIAIDGDTLLGSASLIENDLSSHPHLTPWLSSVYVAGEYRKRGVGSALVLRVMAEARALGMAKLYLVTEDAQPLYAGLGWVEIEEVQQSATVTLSVMVYDFDVDNPAR